MKQRWKDKPLHSQYPELTNKANLDKFNAHRRSGASERIAETEGFISSKLSG